MQQKKIHNNLIIYDLPTKKNYPQLRHKTVSAGHKTVLMALKCVDNFLLLKKKNVFFSCVKWPRNKKRDLKK